MNDDSAQAAMQAGIDEANAATPEEAKRLQQERALIGEWNRRLSYARDFDDNARKQYAHDRRYAKGESGFEVDTNLIGSNIDTMVSFIYAKDPDVDVTPAESVGDQRYADAKDFARTLQIVISRLWRMGRLKRQARRWVRSAQTVGIGWLKVAWQQRMGRDPLIQAQINDLQDNFARAAATMERVEKGEAKDLDALNAELEVQLAALEEQVEVVLSRGLVIDMVAAEDIQVAPGVPSLLDYQDAPWIAHRTFLRPEDAAAAFPELTDAQIRQAAKYFPRKPESALEETPTLSDVTARDADTYRSSDGGAAGTAGDGYLCVWEIWHRDANTVLTLAEGLDRWARKPYTPSPASLRFYPFFGLAFTEVDGERHPQSLVWRSRKLQDEISRLDSNLAEHRRRSLPGVVFNEGEIAPGTADKLMKSGTQQWVGISPTNPNADLSSLFAPKPVASIDPALYNDQRTLARMESIWGLQDAATGGIRVAKTATEAEIQQAGTGSRVGAMRDEIEDRLTEVARYTAELALQTMSLEDVREIAGPEAFWPEGLEIDQIYALVEVDIRAGSSGRPNTARDRESWAAMLPMIQTLIDRIAQLRTGGAEELAQPYIELLKETFNRSGERMDVERFLPPPPPPQAPGMPPLPAEPGMPAGAPPVTADQPPGPPLPTDLPVPNAPVLQ
ncbi:hypothetical protein [Coralloluteibacterium thermophilus]|uniref:Portal protein n=1 Tax=Coralloluteibacterium thermophilum TaxID=2707049 RepID=A0ABV9NHE4_9GAMM